MGTKDKKRGRLFGQPEKYKYLKVISIKLYFILLSNIFTIYIINKDAI